MGTNEIVITGTGLFTPPHSISNDELAASLTIAVNRWNEEHAAEIDGGRRWSRARCPTPEFIEKASGIKSRYVMEKTGVLDPDRLRPHLPTRAEDELGLQAEMALPAVHEALAQAGRRPDEVDCVIVGCSNLQRAYPAVAIEIQHALGAGGWALRHERRLLVGHVQHAGRCRCPEERLGQLRGRGAPRDHLRSQQLRAARPPLHLR